MESKGDGNRFGDIDNTVNTTEIPPPVSKPRVWKGRRKKRKREQGNALICIPRWGRRDERRKVDRWSPSVVQNCKIADTGEEENPNETLHRSQDQYIF